MPYAIVLAPDAAEDFRRLKPHIQSKVRDAIRQHLQHAPTAVSKSRIKRLRGQSKPQYRLRVDEVRVFYDVRETMVEVLGIVLKADAAAWLHAAGGRA